MNDGLFINDAYQGRLAVLYLLDNRSRENDGVYLDGRVVSRVLQPRHSHAYRNGAVDPWARSCRCAYFSRDADRSTAGTGMRKNNSHLVNESCRSRLAVFDIIAD